MTETNTISISGQNHQIYIGDNTTVVSYGSQSGDHVGNVISVPTKSAHISNCYEEVHDYWPRKELDDAITKIQKGKLLILQGTVGTGKTSAALHHILKNKRKFSISWLIDVSTGKDSIVRSFTYLAERLGVSYRDLFTTIESKAENEDIVLLLDNMEKKPSSEWFIKLWNIRRSVHIIITTNNPCLGIQGGEEVVVDKFNEALEFLQGVYSQNTEKDLKELCVHFGWNILGLTVAKYYMLKTRMAASEYLEMQRDRQVARKVRQVELSDHHRILYETVYACFEQVDDDNFSVLAATCVLSNNMIPEFLLSNLLSSNNHLVNALDLNVLHNSLKSLVRITEVNGIRFFSFHSFSQYVITDMVNESLRARLLYKLAGIFIRYVSKDNRFSKHHFLQRIVREHAEIFLKEWEKKEKDELICIALSRLSELVGFSYSQQQPPCPDKMESNFMTARNLLHNLCGIKDEDLRPAEGFLNDALGKFKLLWGGHLENSSNRKTKELYGITTCESEVASQLFTKLTKKSSELSPDLIKEFIFLRTLNKDDLDKFPIAIKETIKKKIELSHPLSPTDLEMFVKHGVACRVDDYRALFLPELYLSIIYSFGRTYFYQDRSTAQNLGFYINLLKIAYCISLEISNRMSPNAVFHEYVVQANGLLYLLVNNDCVSENGKCVKKDAKVHANDLKKAIDRYKQLLYDERKFFETGILKKTKDDWYSKVTCCHQLLSCYKALLSVGSAEDRDEHIESCIQICDDLMELLEVLNTQNIDQKKGDLVGYCKHMNAIAQFYLDINRKEFYPRVIKILTLSSEHAEKYDLPLHHLEALVFLAEIFSRKPGFAATQVSIRHLQLCNSKRGLIKMQRQKPKIQKRIYGIQQVNAVKVAKHYVLLRRSNKRGIKGGRLLKIHNAWRLLENFDEIAKKNGQKITTCKL